MKVAAIVIGWLTAVLLGTSCQQQATIANTVNPVLGDASYVRKYGAEPTAGTDEQTRITAHLQYVEGLLRQKDTRRLPAHLRRQRHKVLNLLNEYWTAGRFPTNYDYPQERRPCFIDRDGRICAVGYLVAQTAGRAVAEKINAGHQYDRIKDMRTPELLAWVQTSGLTLEECAMIQPSYWGPGFPPPSANHVEPAYGAGTAVWSGLNAPLAVLGGLRMAQQQPSKALGVLTLISGAGQAALGAAVLARGDGDSYKYTVRNNETRKAVSYLNIGLGTSTMVLGACNLFSHASTKPAKTSVGTAALPAPDGTSGYVLTVEHRF